MKATDWKNTAKLIKERQSHVATADTSQLSSLPISELSVDASGPPTVLQKPYVPLSTSTPIHVQPANQLTTDSALEESPYQHVIPGIPPQSLYPSLSALGTDSDLAIAPPIPFSRRVINDIEEQQRKALEDTVEDIARSTSTSSLLEVAEEADDTPAPSVTPQQRTTQADTQEETLQLQSSQPEDTGVKMVDPISGQNKGPLEVHNTSDRDEIDV